jgi:hypothetical protein
MKTTKKQKQHYVDNQEFLVEITKYQRRVYSAAIKECPEVKDYSEQQYREFLKGWKSPNRPRVGNYLGGCFLKIATHLSYRPNFINYMYKDDMVCDGIENCIQYIDNFNPEKSRNPFAYFTQIVYYAFLRRIAKEKKQLEIKDKILEKSGYDHVFSVDGEANSDYNQIKSRVELTTKR